MASDPNASVPSAASLGLTPSREELEQLTPQQLVEFGKQGDPIQGPVANAASVVVIQVQNDAMIVFGRPRPLIIGGAFANMALTDTVATIHVSMPTLKDLYLAIGDQIVRFEKDNGEIMSVGTKTRAASAEK